MTPISMSVVMVFTTPPIAVRSEGKLPDKGGLPLVFAIFCLVCAALSLAEVLWPPLAGGISALDAFMGPQL